MEMHDVPQAMELDDVIKVFYEHTNLSSRLREIARSQLVEELQETWRLSSLECEQQNLISTYEKFLDSIVFIPFHIIDLFPNHAF
jgi:hypothetical protein